MASLGVWILLFLGIITIQTTYVSGVAPEVPLGSSMEAPFPERPVLFTSPLDVKNYLDSLGKKARQRYGKRATFQAFRRDLNSRRLESPLDTQDECNCERLKK